MRLAPCPAVASCALPHALLTSAYLVALLPIVNDLSGAPPPALLALTTARAAAVAAPSCRAAGGAPGGPPAAPLTGPDDGAALALTDLAPCQAGGLPSSSLATGEGAALASPLSPKPVCRGGVAKPVAQSLAALRYHQCHSMGACTRLHKRAQSTNGSAPPNGAIMGHRENVFTATGCSTTLLAAAAAAAAARSRAGAAGELRSQIGTCGLSPDPRRLPEALRCSPPAPAPPPPMVPLLPLPLTDRLAAALAPLWLPLAASPSLAPALSTPGRRLLPLLPLQRTRLLLPGEPPGFAAPAASVGSGVPSGCAMGGLPKHGAAPAQHFHGISKTAAKSDAWTSPMRAPGPADAPPTALEGTPAPSGPTVPPLAPPALPLPPLPRPPPPPLPSPLLPPLSPSSGCSQSRTTTAERPGWAAAAAAMLRSFEILRRALHAAGASPAGSGQATLSLKGPCQLWVLCAAPAAQPLGLQPTSMCKETTWAQ